MRRPSASIPARTSARSGTPAPSSPTTRSSPRASAHCASTGRPRSTTTSAKAGRRASTRSRRSYCCTSCRSSTAGTPSGGSRRRSTEGCWPTSATCVSRGRREPSPSGTSTSCGRPTPTALATFLRERGSRNGAPLPGAAPPLAGVRVSRPARGVVPGRRAAVARVPLAADLPRHHRGAARRASPTPSPSTSMADAPANDAPYRLLDDVTFGEDVVVHAVHEPLRLRDRRRARASARSSRSSAAP